MASSRLPPRDAFADRLAGLSQRSFARFVGNLYSAQGWTVSRDVPLLVLRREERIPARRTVLAISGSQDVTGVHDHAVDLVVSASRSSAAERVADDLDADFSGPGDLYDLAMFGVERESTAALFREHFDRDLSDEWDDEYGTWTSSTAPRQTDEGATPRNDTGAGVAASSERLEVNRSSRLRRTAVGTAIALLVVLVVVGAGGGLDPQWALGFDRPTDARGQVTSAQPAESASSVDVATTSAPRDRTGSRGTAVSGEDRSATASQPRYVGLTPTCERPPGLVTVIIVSALRNNDPETDDGIRTAWNFSSRASAGSRYESFASNIERSSFDLLFTHHSAEYTLLSREPGIASHRVTVTGRDGDRRSYVVVLANQTSGPRTGCWLLAGIVPE